MEGAFLSACIRGRIVTQESDVIIVGAGIAGLSLAASLSRQGLQVVLLEAAPARAEAVSIGGGLNDWDRRVSALTPASSALLSEIDVWPDILTAQCELSPNACLGWRRHRRNNVFSERC